MRTYKVVYTVVQRYERIVQAEDSEDACDRVDDDSKGKLLDSWFDDIVDVEEVDE
jgi:hypothetical protein